MTTANELRRTFRAMHAEGCFVMPNPWDVGSALALQALDFKALASTSAGMAWSMGRADNGVALDEVLAHLSSLTAVLRIPLNADFENGFATSAEGVSANVARAVNVGVAGLSIEDSTGDPTEPLFEFNLAVERIAAARSAIDRVDQDTVLTARSEGFLVGRPDLPETIRRLRAFADAGADCLYAPGLRGADQIAEVIRAVAPTPVNVLTPGLNVQDIAALGARRISVGGALARAAWGEFLRAARQIHDHGDFSAFDRGAPGGELNRLFGQASS